VEATDRFTLTTSTSPVYLDHNATTPLHAEVLEAMQPYLTEIFGNPSSDHAMGRLARAAVDEARQQVATLLGCDDDEVLFTSGGTEANNLAIRGVAASQPRPAHIVTSVIEHPATTEPCRFLERRGWEVSWIDVDGTGRVSSDGVIAALRDDTTLVTLMHANNEVGSVQPLEKIATYARRHGVLVHTDAAQSAGKLTIEVDTLNVDLLSIAGHKLYAPKGVGALYVRRGTPLTPLLLGAGHENGLRPGTENVAGAVGLGRACAVAAAGVRQEALRVRTLRDELWSRLQTGVPGVALNGHPSERLPNTLNVRFPSVSGNAMLAAAPEIAASTGSACHAGGEAPSAVLTAMGIEDAVALGAVRLSLGRSTTSAQIEIAAAALVRAYKQVASKPAP